MNNLDTKEWLKNNTDRDKALPEPRFIKREMLYWRSQTHEHASDFSVSPDGKVYRKWRKALVNWYLKVEQELSEEKLSPEQLEVVNKIGDLINGEQAHPTELRDYTQVLNHIMMDMGVLDIGIRQKTSQPYGYEFLGGLPFDMSTQYANFDRLMQNMRNIAKLLRDDVDIAGIIWGPNRVGKTTLSLECNQEINQANGIKMGKEHIVITEEDFWGIQDNKQYSSNHIDEWKLLMYSKDAMTKDQKQRKKYMTTFAKENKALIGCDTNIFNIDKEYRSDKVKFGIHVPRRGVFEFFNKDALEQVDKDSDTGEAITPDPTFKGRFPKLTGELWDTYQEVEDKKLQVREEEEDDGPSVFDIVDLVKKDQRRYKKDWRGKEIINKSLIEADFDIGHRKAKKVKEKVEADLGLG